VPYHVVTGKIIGSKFKIDREELAWCAGFFDGEGCTSVGINRKGTNPTLIFQVTQNEKSTLRRFNKATGNLCRYYKLSTGAWNLRTSRFETVQSIIAMLWFKLANVKKEQYKANLLKYNKNYNSNIIWVSRFNRSFNRKRNKVG
jgi:hypothetical protein